MLAIFDEVHVPNMYRQEIASRLHGMNYQEANPEQFAAADPEDRFDPEQEG